MKKLIPILLFVMLLAPGTALAGSTEIEAGLNPDSRFYWFDRLAERITLVFTLDPQSKSEALSKIGLERLAEAEEVESEETVGQLISEYVKNQNKAHELAGEDIDALTGLNEDQIQALEQLSQLFDDGVAERKTAEAITKTTRLLTKQAKKLEQITQSDNPRAAEKTAKVLNKTTTRLNRLANKLSKQTDDASTTVDKKTTEELAEDVRSATAKHLLVLDGLLEKVPDSAKEAIEKAIERSGKGNETAGDAVGRRGPKTSSDSTDSAGTEDIEDDDEQDIEGDKESQSQSKSRGKSESNRN